MNPVKTSQEFSTNSYLLNLTQSVFTHRSFHAMSGAASSNQWESQKGLARLADQAAMTSYLRPINTECGQRAFDHCCDEGTKAVVLVSVNSTLCNPKVE